MTRSIRYIFFMAVLLVPWISYSAQTPESSSSCPVTLPYNVDAGDAEEYAPDGQTWFANGLWITIPTDGLLAISPNQQLSQESPKYPGWGFAQVIVYRGDGVVGSVEISGKQLDPPTEEQPSALTAGDELYGDTGFRPVTILFPGEGCWQITATVGDASATWVVNVRFVDEPTSTPTAEHDHRIARKVAKRRAT